MSETTVDPSAGADATAQAAANAAAAQGEAAPELAPLTIRSMLEAGIHFGHQTQRWNPRMRPYLFGERNGIHIIDLDQSLPLFREALEFLRDIAAGGGKVLFVGTKRQAAPSVLAAAKQSNQYYVNNRWLGGMLTNWKTVKKSIERYKSILETLGDEERLGELSKKEIARLNRQRIKYEKSLEGIKEMQRLPDAMFVIDVGKEAIAVSEARRLGIPLVGVVDSNNDPQSVDFVIPGNDDAIRAIEWYCGHVAKACIEGEAAHQEHLRAEHPERDPSLSTGRRVVEIKQSPRRSRGAAGGATTGRTASAGGPDGAPANEPAAPAATKLSAPTLAAPKAAAAEPVAAEAEAGADAEPAAADTPAQADGGGETSQA